MKEQNLRAGIGGIPREEMIKNLGSYCHEICSCKRLSQLIMDEETLISFRKNICKTREYKNCGNHLAKLFGWKKEKLPEGMGSVSIEEAVWGEDYPFYKKLQEIYKNLLDGLKK